MRTYHNYIAGAWTPSVSGRTFENRNPANHGEVIGLFQDTLSAVIALAVFLPVISGLGGSSGGQALAVSVRELALAFFKKR